MSNLITVDQATGLIDQFRPELEPLILESGKSFDRLRSVFLIAVQQNPDILRCSPESIRREISKCAADGLVPDNKEAAMIPYKGQLQYQPMVLGIIKRMKELGGVFNIVCNLVYENDEFVLDEADPDTLSHKSDPFSKDRGAIVGGYAAFRDENKRLMHLETMSLDDFERVRRSSRAPDSPAWKNWRNEMYRKAVLRRGAKYISTNNDKIRSLIERQDEMFDFSQNRASDRVNPFAGWGEVSEYVEAKQTSRQRDETAPVKTIDNVPAVEANAPNRTGRVEREKEPSHKESRAGQERKKEDRPQGPPDVPDISIGLDHLKLTTEAVQKILAVALEPDLTPEERHHILQVAAQSWSSEAPEHVKPLLKACIDTSHWAIRQDKDGKPWAADHAAFVLKVKDLIGTDELKVGKYP